MNRLLLFILFLGVIFPGLAGNILAQGIKFHRRGAGEPGKDGWYEARSTEGKFQVALPARFNDFTQTGSSREGGKIIHHVVNALSPQRVTYVASVMISGDNKPLPPSRVEAMAAAAAKEGTLKSKREVVQNGHKGLELYIQETRMGAKMRSFDVAGKRYSLIAEFPADADEKALQEVDRFLDSLKTVK